MKLWKSWWVMITAMIHTIYAIIYFNDEWILLFQNGFFNSISSPRIALAVWFLLFGQLLFIFGQTLYQLEKHSKKVSTPILYHLALMTLIGVCIMPASGFWFMLPPIIAFFRDNRLNNLTTSSIRT